MPFVVFSIKYKGKIGVIWVIFFHSWSLSAYAMTLKLKNWFQNFRIIYELKLAFLNSASDWVIILNYDVARFDVNRM